MSDRPHRGTIFVEDAPLLARLMLRDDPHAALLGQRFEQPRIERMARHQRRRRRHRRLEVGLVGQFRLGPQHGRNRC